MFNRQQTAPIDTTKPHQYTGTLLILMVWLT